MSWLSHNLTGVLNQMRPQMRFDWLDTEGILLDSVSIKPAEDDSDL
jgi:hypothetical protein